MRRALFTLALAAAFLPAPAEAQIHWGIWSAKQITDDFTGEVDGLVSYSDTASSDNGQPSFLQLSVSCDEEGDVWGFTWPEFYAGGTALVEVRFDEGPIQALPELLTNHPRADTPATTAFLGNRTTVAGLIVQMKAAAQIRVRVAETKSLTRHSYALPLIGFTAAYDEACGS